MLQKDWATSLKKTRQQMSMRSSISDQRHTELVQEQMDYYKNELIAATKKNAAEDAAPIVEKLIELRSKQMAILLQKLQQDGIPLNKKTLAPYVRQYYTDCFGIAKAAESLLATKHK